MTTRWASCPDATCSLPAEILAEFFVPSDGEPAGMYTTLCAAGHVFEAVPHELVVEDGELTL